MEGDGGMVIDVEGVWILDGMGMFSCMRAGIGVACGLLRLSPGAQGEHLTSLSSWVTA